VTPRLQGAQGLRCCDVHDRKQQRIADDLNRIESGRSIIESDSREAF